MPRERIPLSTLAIPLGLAGLAQLWSVAGALLGTPFAITESFWAIAAIAWLWTLAAHLLRGARSEQRLSHQLTHLAHGPLAALLPIAAMLFGANLHLVAPLAGSIITLAALAVAAGFAAWMLSFWMRGELPLDAVHGGYFLPISAASLVGALASAQLGYRTLAVDALAVGLFFWLLVSIVFFLRLALRPPLPAPLTPTLAIMVAPPAVAAAAWLTISGGHRDGLFDALSGIAAFMVVIQGMLVPRYLALRFSLGFWSFTFPAAITAALAVRWLGLMQPPGWQAAIAGLLVIITGLIVLIAANSLRSLRTTAQVAAQ